MGSKKRDQGNKTRNEENENKEKKNTESIRSLPDEVFTG